MELRPTLAEIQPKGSTPARASSTDTTQEGDKIKLVICRYEKEVSLDVNTGLTISELLKLVNNCFNTVSVGAIYFSDKKLSHKKRISDCKLKDGDKIRIAGYLPKWRI